MLIKEKLNVHTANLLLFLKWKYLNSNLMRLKCGSCDLHR